MDFLLLIFHRARYFKILRKSENGSKTKMDFSEQARRDEPLILSSAPYSRPPLQISRTCSHPSTRTPPLTLDLL